MKAKHIFPAIAASLLFVKCDCANTTASLFISPNSEYQIGEDFHRELRIGTRDTVIDGKTIKGTPAALFLLNPKLGKDSTGKNVDESADAQKVASYVDSIGRMIAANISESDWQSILPSGYSNVDKKNFFQFRVIKDSTVNAFAVAGGKTYFYTGILKNLKSEAELIGVMSHEMGHVVEHHTRNRLLKAYGASAVLAMLTGGEQPGLLSQVGLAWFLNNNGQDDELEADSMGVYLANQSGANPTGIRSFFSNGLVFDKDSNCTGENTTLGKIFQSFSTHPANCERVTHARNLEKALPNSAEALKRSVHADEYVKAAKILPGYTAGLSDFDKNFAQPLARILKD